MTAKLIKKKTNKKSPFKPPNLTKYENATQDGAETPFFLSFFLSGLA